MKVYRSKIAILMMAISVFYGVACSSSSNEALNTQLQKQLLENNPGEKSGDPCAAFNAEDFFMSIRGKYTAEAQDPNIDLQNSMITTTPNDDGTFVDGTTYNMTIFSDGIAINTELGIKVFNFNHDNQKPENGDDNFQLISDDSEESIGHVAKASMDHTVDAELPSEVVIDRSCLPNNSQLTVSFYPDYNDPGFPFEGTWRFVLVENQDTSGGEF